MSDTEELWVWLHWKDDGFQFEVDKAKYSLMEWRGEITKSEKSLMEWGAAFALPIAAATAMVVTTNELIKSAEAYQSQVQQFAYVTGMSTDATQKWRAAAIATDTDFGALTSTLQHLNARITDESAAGDELRSTLDEMGVAYKDSNGNYLDSDTLLQNILRSMSRLSTAQEKDAAANAIFGRSWFTLAEMINKSDEALVAYANHEPAFSQEELDAIDEYKTKWAELADRVELAKAQIALPIMNALLGIEDIGAKSGVEFSSMGMAVTGVGQYLTTGNAATLDEAAKRMLHPEQYTRDALAAQQAAELASAGGTVATPGSFTDKYAGMSTQQLQLAQITEQIAAAEEKRSKAVTATDYDKYSLQIAQLTAKEKDLKDAIAETAKEAEAKSIKTLTDATDEYSDSLKKVLDLERDRADLSADAVEDLTDAMGDPEQFRSILKEYRRAERESDQSLGSAEANVRAAGAAVYNTVNPGTVKSGDVVINLDGVEIARVKGVANTAANEVLGLSKSDLTKAGVRMS